MQDQGASADPYFLDVPFDELTERYALKIHGYVFSDEDGSTDSGGLSDFDEEYARLKPPPLKLNSDNLIVIKPQQSNGVNREDLNLQEKKHTHTKNKKFSSRNEQKIQNKFAVSVNNFYSLLGQSDNDESVKDSEIQNKPTEEADRKVSKRKKKKEKKQMKSDTPLENHSCSFVRRSGEFPHCEKGNQFKNTHVRNRVDDDDDKTYMLDLHFFLTHLPFNFWTEEILYIMYCLDTKIETQRTSWDNVSTNNVYRSDKLLEQEHYDIVHGSKICTYCSGHDCRRTKALENLLEVTGMPFVAYLAKKFWTALDNETFLSVVGVLIAAFIYTRCK